MTTSEAPTHLLGDVPSEHPRDPSFQSAWTDPPPLSAVDDPLIGTTLSRTYRITGVLGEGGMGRVYEAWHTRITKKRFALKVLHPEFAREPEILRRFQREAEAAASVDHRNAVGVYDVALTPQGWPYLVCEFLEGIDLAQHIKAVGPLSITTTKHIVLQICNALCEAHASGVIHRDLKPQNVFLVGDFRAGVPTCPDAKVLDFGLSRFLDGSDTELTKTGVIMGTPSYMAPEQAKGLRADHRVDVYGVGVILYSVLTGKPPFRADTPQSTLLAVIAEEAPRPTSLNPSISASLELVIQRAMAKDAEQRYPDMAALRAAIEGVSVEVDRAGRPAEAARRVLRSEHDSDANIRTARSRLAAFLGIACATGFAGLTTAIACIVVLYVGRWPLTRSETLLSLLIVIGTLLTPALLLILHVRKAIWSNTARVIELLVRVREAVEAAFLTYGAGALGLLFFDSVVRRLLSNPDQFRPLSERWPVMGVVLTVAALFAIGTVTLRAALQAPGGWTSVGVPLRRWLAGPLLTTTGALAVAVTLLFGALSGSRTLTKAPAPAPAATTAKPTATAVPHAPSSAASTASVPSSRAAARVDALPDLALASDEDLSAGISQGLAALEPLMQRYPADPRVLRAAGVAYASRAASMGQALSVFERLFRVAPKTVNDSDLQNMVSRISTASGNVGDRAFEVMKHSMGSVGPDMLYRIALSRPQQREIALKHLASASVRAKFSPELAIAYELHFAPTCASRVPLLSRAEQLGDERSLMVLQPLAASKPTGCGTRKRQPCKPQCASEAEAFKKTIEAIAVRLRRVERDPARDTP